MTKITKIITGISVLACLGAFIPNSASAIKCSSIYDEKTCKEETSCEWRAEFQCQPNLRCHQYTEQDKCLTNNCIWWGGKPRMKTCHQKEVSSRGKEQ